MQLLNWDPFRELAQLRERINRLFEESLSGREPAETGPWAPLVDIYETDQELVLAAELPGLSREQIGVELDGDRLTLKGERKADAGRSYLRVERPQGPFERSFTLNVPVDESRMTATYRDGVLEIVLPKAGEAKPRRVEVEVE